jgi:membrane associated rhomboid family serine protease
VIPLRDDNPTALFPLVTLALIAANVCVWLYYQGAGSPEPMIASICQYGVIPADLTGAAPEPGTPMICPSNSLMWETLFTSMFLHGGWLHLIGNMWFLWIFGNNIEDSMGHVRFLLFYTLTGLVAGGAHVWFLPDSTIPTVGASGAISGVMGAYLILYPRVRVQTLLLIIIFVRIIPIPAWLILLYWFVLQIFLGAAQDVEQGGIAFWAHIGGFVAGVAAVKLFEDRRLTANKLNTGFRDRGRGARLDREKPWL